MNKSDLTPSISILIAVRNEERHLTETLEAIQEQICDGPPFETLIIDGDSTDSTLQIADQFTRSIPMLRVLSNSRLISAAGWNVGIENANAPIILILSGHAILPKGYLAKIYPGMSQQIAGIGGQAVPKGEGIKGRAIALAFSTVLGNGNAIFMNRGSGGFTDTIAYGCYWKKSVTDVGCFDESLYRGQDWDLNIRLRKNGGKLLFEPNLRIHFYTRSDFRTLWTRQYQAGRWKPVIHKTNSYPFSKRHLLPSVLVLSMISSAAAFALTDVSVPWPLLVIGLHIGASAFAFKWKAERTHLFPIFWWSLLLIHVAYGFGFIVGLILSLQRRSSSNLKNG